MIFGKFHRLIFCTVSVTFGLCFIALHLLQTQVHFQPCTQISQTVPQKEREQDILTVSHSQNGLSIHEKIVSSRFDKSAPLFIRYPSYSKCEDLRGKEFWKCFQNGHLCPPELLLRLGSFKDGRKWTCGVAHLGNLSVQEETFRCVAYSFGIAGDSSFEAELLQLTNCQVFVYDPSVSEIGEPIRPSNSRVRFQKLGIGPNNSENIWNLDKFMEKNGGHQWIDILKLDIESGEYLVLENILETFPELPFGQLLLEFHNFDAEDDKRDWVVDLVERLGQRGLRIFSSEVNVYYANHASEFSFINLNVLGLFMPEADVISKQNMIYL